MVNNNLVASDSFIEVLIDCCNQKSAKNYWPMPSDEPVTFDHVDDLVFDIDFSLSSELCLRESKLGSWYILCHIAE